MKNSLVLSEEPAIAIGTAPAQSQGLLFPDVLTAESHRSIRLTLRRIGRDYPWYVGDYALRCQREAEQRYEQTHAADFAKGQSEEKIAKAQAAKRRAGVEGVYVMADDLRQDRGKALNSAAIAAFYPLAARRGKLTFEHHAAAIRGSGSGLGAGALAKAEGWLDKAEGGGLKVSELRAEINRANATATPPGQAPEENPYEALDDADRWATQHKGDAGKLSQEHASMLLIRFAALVEWVQAVCDRASGPPSPSQHR